MREQLSEHEQKDEEIARLIQSGQLGFFDILIERYEVKIRRYARKFLSEQEDINDVLQDIFIKTYKNIQGFDPKRKFSSWLYRIAHNELINVLKKKKKNPLPLFDLDVFFPHYSRNNNNVKQEINRQEMSKMIDKCLAQLSAKYREPMILYYFEDLSYQEIADILEIPISTVGIRLKRAKEIIRKIYQKYER